jgi:hypothetical protein
MPWASIERAARPRSFCIGASRRFPRPRGGKLNVVLPIAFDGTGSLEVDLYCVSFQNDIHRFALAVVILHAKSNKLGDLRPLLPELLSRLPSVAPGRALGVGKE